MNHPILGYRKTGKDTWQPVTNPPGYIYSAAFLHCVKCGAMISGMGVPSTNTVCVPCYDQLKDE